MSVSPYRTVADALKTILDTEFTDIGVNAQHDNINEALGATNRAVGIAPDMETPVDREEFAQHTLLVVKFFDRWDPQIDPAQRVDPRVIADKAHRFREAVQAYNQTATASMWYFQVRGVEYPDDPTGNKTRFIARIRAWGNNAALVETAG